MREARRAARRIPVGGRGTGRLVLGTERLSVIEVHCGLCCVWLKWKEGRKGREQLLLDHDDAHDAYILRLDGTSTASLVLCLLLLLRGGDRRGGRLLRRLLRLLLIAGHGHVS